MNGRIVVGALVILIGIGFLIGVSVISVLFPIIIILIGIRVIIGKGDQWNFARHSVIREDSIKRVFVFSGAKSKVESSNFQKAEIVAVFGGAEMDLSGVSTKARDIEMELVAVFGGVRIKIPKNWSISSEGVGILGGFDNKTSPNKKDVRVTLKGVAILGGVEVFN